MTLFNLTNVFYDKSSRNHFEDLNESVFIKKLFMHLVEIMGERFVNYDFYVYSHQGRDRIPASVSLQSLRKKVLIFFSDEIGSDPSSYSPHYFAVFKAYIGENFTASNVFPMPLGYVRDVPELVVKPLGERTYNVFFRGNLNANRIDLYRNLSFWKFLLPPKPRRFQRPYIYLLLKLRSNFSKRFVNSYIFFNRGFKRGLSPADYGNILSDSRIVLCPRGFENAECFRHYESMRMGCIIISERLPKTDFYHGSPIIEVDNWKDGIAKVDELLSNTQRMEAIHKQTTEWWHEKCSEQATARYLNAKLTLLEQRDSA